MTLAADPPPHSDDPGRANRHGARHTTITAIEPVDAPVSSDRTAELVARLDRLAGTMDTRFSIPGTKIGVGLDALIGLLPVVGDVATVVPGAYIIHMGRRLGVRRRTTLRMTWNLAADWALGLVPLVGDLLDVGFRSNTKNVELIKRDLALNPDV